MVSLVAKLVSIKELLSELELSFDEKLMVIFGFVEIF